MVQRSDDKGDKRSQSKSSESVASPDADPGAVKALRERIRQAGAATARASDHAPPPDELLVPHSSAPPSGDNNSGIRARPAEPRSISITPQLFAPKLKQAPMSVPWPTNPAGARRSLATTRVGLGMGTGSQDKPLDAGSDPHAHAQAQAHEGEREREGERADEGTISGPAPAQTSRTPMDEDDEAAFDELTLSTARTQPMPRVRSGLPGSARAQLPTPVGGMPAVLDDAERRRIELATTRKTQGLLRAPDGSQTSAGRYSVQDVSTEYVDTGAPPDELPGENSGAHDAILETDAEFDGEPAAGPELEGEGTRPRRSTPKQRVGHRRSSRPEVSHGRVERGTKRTDPGIRARTLRGSAPAASAPTAVPAASDARTSAPVRGPSAPPQGSSAPTSTVVVDPSLSWPPRPAEPAPARTPPRAAPRSSSYVPLPRDREAYEAFLRSAAADSGGPSRARPSWAQQETALIPREALEPPPEEPSSGASLWRSNWLRSGLGAVCIVVGALGFGWSLRDETAHSPSQDPLPPVATPVDPAVPATGVPLTLISTEPSGAELLVGGAVIGNTPLEVRRPSQGEELYLLRLRGFEPQMVKISLHSREAMHITLAPAAEPARPRR